MYNEWRGTESPTGKQAERKETEMASRYLNTDAPGVMGPNYDETPTAWPCPICEVGNEITARNARITCVNELCGSTLYVPGIVDQLDVLEERCRVLYVDRAGNSWEESTTAAAAETKAKAARLLAYIILDRGEEKGDDMEQIASYTHAQVRCRRCDVSMEPDECVAHLDAHKVHPVIADVLSAHLGVRS